MTIDEKRAAAAAAQTLAYYEQNAASYRDGTMDHDVNQNIDALLQHIESDAPFKILDLGCGPGRDLRRFTARGHVAIGLDGTASFVEMARTYSGCEVWLQDFLDLELPTAYFDGVFANAALFHVPSCAVPQTLRRVHATLKPGGVVFSSNPRGENQEGWNGERYGAFYDLETWRALMSGAGFTELTHYYRPAGLPRDQQPWLASVWRKVGP